MLRNLSETYGGNRLLGSPFVGLLASEITSGASSGTHGAGLMANDGLEAGKRYRLRLADPADVPGTVFADGGAVVESPCGFEYELFENNLLVGSAVSVSIGQNTGPAITNQPDDTAVNEGATASFIGAAAGAGGLTYQWQRQAPAGGAWVNVGTNSSSYTTPATDCTADHGAQFRFIVTDSVGQTTSDPAALTVRSVVTPARPVADITATGWSASIGVSIFDTMDEPTASDADFAVSPALSGSTAPATLELRPPLSTGTWAFKVRARTSTGAASLRGYLLDDAGAVVGSSSTQPITDQWATYSVLITTSAPATRARIEILG